MDISQLLKSLNDHHVKYIVIGASAMPAHGYVRVTGDIDILIEPTRENARHTLDALAAIGYDVADLTVEVVLTKKILFRQYILATDVHPSVKGVTFKTVWKNKKRDRIEGVPVYIASLDDLIKMKSAANRPKDREDLKALRAIKKLKRKK
ncbi:MAG TPA: nucleotidyltransferase [Anaerolineae bacterium]|nr:nucleotidyltransferase [Anaerolineae bacterium]